MGFFAEVFVVLVSVESFCCEWSRGFGQFWFSGFWFWRFLCGCCCNGCWNGVVSIVVSFAIEVGFCDSCGVLGAWFGFGSGFSSLKTVLREE